MPTRNSKMKTHHMNDQNEENSLQCISTRLDIETISLTELQVDETSLRKENELTQKMKDEIRKSEIKYSRFSIHCERTH